MLKVKKLICSTIAAAAVFSAVAAPSALISSNSSTPLVNSINAEASSALGTIEALQNVNIRTDPYRLSEGRTSLRRQESQLL